MRFVSLNKLCMYSKYCEITKDYPVKKIFYLNYTPKLSELKLDKKILRHFDNSIIVEDIASSDNFPNLSKDALISKVKTKAFFPYDEFEYNLLILKSFQEHAPIKTIFFDIEEDIKDVLDVGQIYWNSNGFVFYEHMSYYPEFIDMWTFEDFHTSVNVPGFLSNFKRYWEDNECFYKHFYDFYYNDPCYGEKVNSLCWSGIYPTVSSFLEEDITYTKQSILRNNWQCFYNKEFERYVPKTLVSCLREEKVHKNIPEYNFYYRLSVNNQFNKNYNFIVYYPKQTKYKSIKILIHNLEYNHKINVEWMHGEHGLFKEIKRHINSSLIQYSQL